MTTDGIVVMEYIGPEPMCRGERIEVKTARDVLLEVTNQIDTKMENWKLVAEISTPFEP